MAQVVSCAICINTYIRMKNILIIFSFVLLLTSCNSKVEISVFNNSEVDRKDEMVEICLCQLTNFDPSKIIVLNAEGKEIPCQILFKGEEKPASIIFPVTLKAGKQVTFVLQEGVPEKFKAKTYARFVPERKDDMAWENDRIGFRMYGPALASENPSNGVDVWLKRTTDLIINKWYKNELSGKASYHEDHGEGLDCYKVANTLGAGGICPYTKDSLWIGKNFDRYKILDNGPLRSSFVLFYDSIPFGNKTLKAELLITLDAGSNLNEAVIKYSGDSAKFQLAAGIYLHDSIQSVNGSIANGYLGYAENSFSQNDKPVASGRCYTGIVFSEPIVETKQWKNHLLGICNYKIGEEFRYFFGAGWNKHGFASDQDWFAYLSSRRASIQQPLEVKMLK